MFPPRNADPVEFPLLLIFEARAGLRLFEALDPIRDVINFLGSQTTPENVRRFTRCISKTAFRA